MDSSRKRRDGGPYDLLTTRLISSPAEYSLSHYYNDFHILAVLLVVISLTVYTTAHLKHTDSLLWLWCLWHTA
jgi:hypothetical protein